MGVGGEVYLPLSMARLSALILNLCHHTFPDCIGVSQHTVRGHCEQNGGHYSSTASFVEVGWHLHKGEGWADA